MEMAAKAPLLQRINLRILIFSATVLFLLGTPVYIFIDETLSGGVKDRGDYLEVDLKALSGFELNQQSGTLNDVPEQWRRLDGRRVLLVGEIWAPRQAGGKITNFQLVYSIAKCCFSGPPKVQHFIDASVIPGKNVDIYPNLVRVIGTLRVNVKHEAGKVASVFQLDVERVEPVT